MTDADEEIFVDELRDLAAGYRVEITPQMARAYWRFLRSLELGDFRRGAQAAGEQSECMPSAATIRKFAAATSKARFHSGNTVPGVAETQRYLQARDLCNFHRQRPDVAPPEAVHFCPTCQRLGPRRLRAVGDGDCEPIGALVKKWGES